LANELYKNIIQRLPAALILVASIIGILYLQNILITLALSMGVGFLLIKEWLFLSDSKVDLKQIIFFVTFIILSIYYSFYLFCRKLRRFISCNNINILGYV